MKVLNHGLERPTGGLWIFADPRPHASPPPSKAEAMRVGEKLERKANAAIAHQVAVQMIAAIEPALDRKSTRLNSSHVAISYAVFCFQKKIKMVRSFVLYYEFVFTAQPYNYSLN